jgi:hypothetical protein
MKLHTHMPGRPLEDEPVESPDTEGDEPEPE